MPKIRDLKRFVNNELSEVIEDCYVWQLVNADKADKAEDIIDESILFFDKFIERINEDNVQNKKAHFQGINADLAKVKSELLDKLAKL